MVGGCIHGAHLLSFNEIRANGFNLPHFWQNTALMVAETLLNPFRYKAIRMSRFVAPTGMSEVTDGCWVHLSCTQLSFIEIKAK